MKTQGQRGQGRAFRVYEAASFGAAIKHFRAQRGMTQAELAERSGLHRSYLSEMEEGKETERVRRLLDVLHQLGLRVTIEEADW